ncbi:MAG: non-hydrolyzing UDP-N-acetylglucosamine 2-epimerase [Fidelibacterota bacterium]
MKPRVMVCFGTRPEVIKVASTLSELSRRKISFTSVLTGQHHELFHYVQALIPAPDFNLEIMEENQSPARVLAQVAARFRPLVQEAAPDIVIVQGDTVTAMAVALVSFYEKAKVGHIEAGLRTYDPGAPFPEEVNRQIISRVAHIHWAPTQRALENLIREGVDNAILTGNTVVDVCLESGFPVRYGTKVVITLHRRENFGERMESMFQQIENLARTYPELEFVFPMHPNPEVQRHRNLLQKTAVVKPLEYREFLRLLSEAKFVITDSGGIQEECAAYRKRVLVCRDKTERPEGVEAGLARVVGTEIEKNFSWANDDPRWDGENPFGDGKAANRIVDSILQAFEK